MEFKATSSLGFDDFTNVSDFRIKCNHCGEEIDVGIYSIVKHSDSCVNRKEGVLMSYNRENIKEIFDKLFV